jgi:hypothetical protein
MVTYKRVIQLLKQFPYLRRKLAMQTYKGILVLDHNTKKSFLQQEDSTGVTLMMLDDSPSGNFTPVKVTAAYLLFKDDPNVDDGDPITVSGFRNTPPGATSPVLHISPVYVIGG